MVVQNVVSISYFLNIKNINYFPQYKFQNCKKIRLLGFDFYLPDYNLCIEYQGEHHYRPIDFAGKGEEWAEKEFKNNQIKDQIKRDYCKENGINLLEISYWEFNNIDNILMNIQGDIL